MSDKNYPQEEGFYWARTKGMRYWNLIVWVYGQFPFFDVDSWSPEISEYKEAIDVGTIEEFGPMITDPAIEGEREDWR